MAKRNVEEKKQLVLQVLKERGPITRNELSKITGIPRTTLYDLLTKLILEGKVEKYALRDGRRGRPKIYWEAV